MYKFNNAMHMYGQGARCAQIHHVNDCVDPLVNNNNNNIYIFKVQYPQYNKIQV